MVKKGLQFFPSPFSSLFLILFISTKPRSPENIFTGNFPELVMLRLVFEAHTLSSHLSKILGSCELSNKSVKFSVISRSFKMFLY
ncbi:MAG: hypothetical protein BRC30_01890 [Nanohaloarchaea archaeon SW_7_46_7]|nr:MAG: hypothetical protein BRC30_01890 [Nanohaloarchaea archaeon SW_7_46_7]